MRQALGPGALGGPGGSGWRGRWEGGSGWEKKKKSLKKKKESVITFPMEMNSIWEVSYFLGFNDCAA